MSTQIIIKISDEKARGLKWLLGKKYGERKSLETLVKLAANEIALEQAKLEVEDSMRKVEEA